MKLDLPKDRELDAGLWYSTPASTFYPVHFHDELELKIVLWGRAAVAVGRRRVELGPGTQLWLAPGQEHVLLDVSRDFTMWVGSFRTRAVRAAERRSGARVLDRRVSWGACVLPLARMRELSGLCARQLTLEEPRELNALSGRLLAGALDAWSEQRHAGGRPRPSGSGPSPSPQAHPAVARARTLLQESGDGDVPLESLARSCALSAPRLSRLFRREMGLSTVQFRNHHRVQRFIAQLGHGGERSMLELALEVGFGSYAQFHRAFWQVAGYAPAEHLRRVRAGIVTPTPLGDASAAARPRG